MLTVVTMLWTDPHSRKPYTYDERYPISLKKQVDKYVTFPHEFICITDSYSDQMKEAGIKHIELDRTTHRSNTRFMKLQIFSERFAEQVPGQILYLDLDCVIVGNIDSVVDRKEDLVLWRNPNYGIPKRAFYNTSILLHRTGTRVELYDNFEVVINSDKYKQYPYAATDQKYISFSKPKDMPHWTDKDGIYGLGRIGDKDPDKCSELPSNACIIFTPGRRTQFTKEVQNKHPWLKQYIL